MPRSRSGNCSLCQRHEELTFHHLIPRTLHSNRWFKRRFTREDLQSGIDVCRDCHSAVHHFVGAKELGRHYHTRDLLLGHEQVRRFVDWIARRGPMGRVRTRPPVG